MTVPPVVWQYLQVDDEPDLVSLGRDRWELVAIQNGRWIFKRPAPGSSERFTLEQREQALSDPEAARARSRTLLNAELAALIRRVNHTQMLLIVDRGFPLPHLRWTLDLALSSDVPTVPQVLKAVLPELPVDRVILASEMEAASPQRWALHRQGAIRTEAIPHLEFKRLAGEAVGVVRTGDSAPYSNILLVGG